MVRIINIDTKARTIRVSNGKDDLEWFTTDTGSHVPLKKGQSKAEAIKEHFGDGRSSGKKRLDELNKKYGTNKGYLIQSDRPLDKKKDGVIKEYEDFGKATPEVSLTETGSGFHERTKQPAKREPYSDPFHKEAEQKRNAAKDAWLKAKPQVDIKKLRAGDPETLEKYMDWRWQAITLSDGYDEMIKDFGSRDGFIKAAKAYEKLKK